MNFWSSLKRLFRILLKDLIVFHKKSFWSSMKSSSGDDFVLFYRVWPSWRRTTDLLWNFFERRLLHILWEDLVFSLRKIFCLLREEPLIFNEKNCLHKKAYWSSIRRPSRRNFDLFERILACLLGEDLFFFFENTFFHFCENLLVFSE